MNLLLIRPSNAKLYPSGERKTFLEPLGLEYIASECELCGFDTTIADLDCPNGASLSSYLDSNPDYVGISVVTPLLSDVKYIIKQVRERTDATIILGGPHISAMNGSLISEGDITISGEGEVSLSELLWLEEETVHIEGFIRHNIDDYIFPSRLKVNRESYKLDHDFGHKQNLASVITSRSCPYQCVFCGSKNIFGSKLRVRSVENVKRELIELKNIGINTIIFLDDTFTFYKKRTLELCDVIGELGFSYWLDTRVDSVDGDILKALKDSGCGVIVFGDESGDDEILKRIKKGITTKQIMAAHEASMKAGIHTKANFMIGHPGETREQAMRTLSFAKTLPADKVSVYKCIPLPGTALFDILNSEQKKDFDSFAWYKNPPSVSAMTTEELDELQKMAYAK